MRRTFLSLIVLLSALWLGPEAPPAAGAPRGAARAAGHAVVVFLVRHAEKADDGSRDPSLTAAGRARASLLARMIGEAGLTAVFSTDFRRTRETAAPSAAAAGVDVTLYDPRKPAGLTARLRSTPGRYLVIGHSNTVPELVHALGGDPGKAMGEAEYDRLYVVVIEGGEVTTLRLHYGEPSGGPTMGASCCASPGAAGGPSRSADVAGPGA
jgi:phosphohistidine phosphatase SixA